MAWIQSLIDVESDPAKLHILNMKIKEDQEALTALMPDCQVMRDSMVEARLELAREEKQEKLLSQTF